jgi:glucose-1-phosphate thymidylyltransferase
MIDVNSSLLNLDSSLSMLAYDSRTSPSLAGPKFISKLSPSKRGELEMIDLLEIYNSKNQLTFSVLSNKDRWYDCGNINDLVTSSNNLEKIKNRLLTPEYLAFKNNWISEKKFTKIISSFPESYYKKHNIELLQKLI